MRYSKIFEKAALDSKDNSKFLFEIADSEDSHEENDLIDLNDEQELSLDQLTTAEDENYNEIDYPEPDYQTGPQDPFSHEDIINRRNNPQPSELSHFYQNSLKVILVQISIEIMIMMLMFTLFYFLTKLIFPHIIMSNWKILFVSFLFYCFTTSFALFFNGAFISHRVFNAILVSSNSQ